MAKLQKHPPGGYAGIPRVVMKTADYVGLSYKAKALLQELAFQYKGGNNGDLTVALSVLRSRGWKREATISAAVSELMNAKLIVRTREGRFSNPGSCCALYAVAWKSINECSGKRLDHPPTINPPRKFSMEGKSVCKMPVTHRVAKG